VVFSGKTERRSKFKDNKNDKYIEYIENKSKRGERR